jgi:hypothetical protein
MQGYCTSSTSCKSFAVVLADFGSALATPTDQAALSDLAAYLQPLCGLPACLAADGAHAPIYSWFWAGWTPDLAGAQANLPNTQWAGRMIWQTVSYIAQSLSGRRGSTWSSQALSFSRGYLRHLRTTPANSSTEVQNRAELS